MISSRGASRTTARARFGAIASCLALAACPGSSAGPRRGQSAPSFPLTPCHLAGDGVQVIDAECGTLTVPENRSAAAAAGGKGRTIDLAIAVVKASGRNPLPDALFFLAGGPGQSALETYPSIAGSFSRINLEHDIVLVDQRGTGASAPLSCPETEIEATRASPAEVAARARRCREELEQKADLTQYTTRIATIDLDLVREKLGYARIDLYGGSYGTRVALQYLRHYPEHVRAVVLDGVAPPDWVLGSTLGRDGQRVLDRLFARCADDPGCARAFPNLPASLATLLSKYETPETVVVAHPTTAAATPVTVSRASIAATLRALSYASETAAILPLLVHTTVATGDLHPIAAQSLILADFMKIHEGMHLAVECSEDAPRLDAAKLDADNAGTYDRGAAGRLYLDACQGWPRAEVAPEDLAPVTSDVPVLLLSGELDPVTPPSNAAAAARTLPNSFQVVVPGEGHGALPRSCTRRIVDAFLERASVVGLSADCLKDARPMQFFTSFEGPQP